MLVRLVLSGCSLRLNSKLLCGLWLTLGLVGLSSLIPQSGGVLAQDQPARRVGEVPASVSAEGAAYLEKLRRNTPFGTNGFDLEGLRRGMAARRALTVEGVVTRPVKIGELPGEWVLAPGADPRVRVLYLHGGGFVSGSGGFYLPLAGHLSKGANCAVLLVDYRLAPEHPFPAGLNDCVAAHEWLRSHGPEGDQPALGTFVAGDSAGGNLSLATLLALKSRKLPLPRGVISISPAADLTLQSESLQSVVDPIISSKTMPEFRRLYLGDQTPDDPLASPVFGDYRDTCPLLIQAGEHEMLRDDSTRVARRARETGAEVHLEIWRGMFHVFQSHDPLLPEGREAVEHIARFIRGLLPPAD